MKLNRTPNPLDRTARNGENDNWDIIEGNLERVEETISDLVLESGGDSNLEVVQARGGKPVLNDRLNEIDTQLAHKANKTYVDNETNSLNNRISNVENEVGKFGNWSIEENTSLNSLDFVWRG